MAACWVIAARSGYDGWRTKLQKWVPRSDGPTKAGLLIRSSIQLHEQWSPSVEEKDKTAPAREDSVPIESACSFPIARELG